MRQIIAVCRSEKRSRVRVAKVLDRYFWRIGYRTWRGKATNACLDRAAHELRKKATRNTAVVIYEIRSSSESRKPLIRIGSKLAFSDEGLVPISSHPAAFSNRQGRCQTELSGIAIIGIAALFHDLGKATNLFQNKLRNALTKNEPKADAVRHELISAAVWDNLFGSIKDKDLPCALKSLSPKSIDIACQHIRNQIKSAHSNPSSKIDFTFLKNESSISQIIGMLILTHHRLPSADSDHLTMTWNRHVRDKSSLNRDEELTIAKGTPFWYEDWWKQSLVLEASRIVPNTLPSSLDIALRASLMFADHLGSAKKTPSNIRPNHLANTIKQTTNRSLCAGDSLSRHIKRVYRYSRYAHASLFQDRDSFPSIVKTTLPRGILNPSRPEKELFEWQHKAAMAARNLCKNRAGGFFAAIMSGTGTGKTRGAPTILANATFFDKLPYRRYFRMNLCLGLRVLAKQSAREYVKGLKFSSSEIAVMIGTTPIDFPEKDQKIEDEVGHSSYVDLPDWISVEQLGRKIPEVGTSEEKKWLQSLSLDTHRGLPLFLDRVLDSSDKDKSSRLRLFLEAPIMVGTIDHLMGVASPINSRFLMQTVRLISSDLILDEIDQYDSEDLAAVVRLVFQSGAAGRRVIIMSATLTDEIIETFYRAYNCGWKEYARSKGICANVNILLCGENPASVLTNSKGQPLPHLIQKCRNLIIKDIRSKPALRRGEILCNPDNWKELVKQIDQGCSRLHDINSINVKGYRVSVGLVKMTRIVHTVALASQIPSGNLKERNHMRFLVCVHAHLPRLNRAYIETELHRALNRKGRDPSKGLFCLCDKQDVFRRTSDKNLNDIEIVIITSPVIETGNDLDFDYAILDPISTRSIIQASGRVQRHRLTQGEQNNVLILGRSPVAMQSGRLENPGIETYPSPETKISRCNDLEKYTDRLFKDLLGDADVSRISAELLLSNHNFPLKEAEIELRKKMLSTGCDKPLGRYLNKSLARWNLEITRSRKFRRSITHEFRYILSNVKSNLYDADWFLEFNQGNRNPARKLSKHIHSDRCLLFLDLTEEAWRQYSGDANEIDSAKISEVMRVSIPVYPNELIEPFMTYSEFTGFSRGNPVNLFEDFGKSRLKQ